MEEFNFIDLLVWGGLMRICLIVYWLCTEKEPDPDDYKPPKYV